MRQQLADLLPCSDAGKTALPYFPILLRLHLVYCSAGFPLFDKVLLHRERAGTAKNASRRHTVHLILCSGFNAVADKRQRSSAASELCRRMCPISAPHKCLRSRSAACAGAAGTSGCPPSQSLSGSSCAPGVWLVPFPHALPAQGSGSAVAPVHEIHLTQSGNAVIEVPQAQRLSILELLILKSVISLSRT